MQVAQAKSQTVIGEIQRSDGLSGQLAQSEQVFFYPFLNTIHAMRVANQDVREPEGDDPTG